MKKLLSILMAIVFSIGVVGCSSEAVAKVDGTSISKKEFEEQLKFYKWQVELQYGDSVWDMMKARNSKYQDELKSQLLNTMTRTQIFLNYAKKNDIKADSSIKKQVKSQLENILKNSKAKTSYDKLGLSKDFIDNLAEKQGLLAGVSKFLEKKTSPTEQEIKEYYEKNRDQVDASHIIIKTTDSKGKVLSEEKKAEAKKKAETIYNKAKNGEDFATLAKEYSEEASTASKGGNLGQFGKGVMVPEFEKAVFALKEGEISKPVETQYGYHIIKLNKKTKMDYNKNKESLKKKVAQSKVQKLVQEISKSSKIETNDKILKSISFGEVKKTNSNNSSNSNSSKDNSSKSNSSSSKSKSSK